ncbi:COMM domain-containing protein 4-like [Convolutriloba macropyga]|uniref:COMM domain-containing protein 4-like n=1 Tax=Convolutriloba macropyga TaxID=536237 RepID=UPI003F51BDCC
MKFKFCRDLDCPDWVLAEISNLSKVSSVKLKLICNQAIKLLTNDVSFDSEKVEKHLTDAKLNSEDDVKGILAAIVFLLKGAISNQVPNEDFVSEMQQLGLPKEHSVVLGKAQQSNSDLISKVLKENSFRVNRLLSCTSKPNFHLVETTEQHEWGTKMIKCETVLVEISSSAGFENEDKFAFNIDKEKLKLLIYELKTAQNIANRYVEMSSE